MTRVSKALIFFFLVSVPVNGQDIPRPSGWVNDFAQVLSEETEARLNQKIGAYKNETGIELAVVTIPSLGGSTVEDVAEKVFNTWGIGDEQKDNGVLLLLAPNERKVRIEVGYGLEGDLTDGQSGYILDKAAIPYLKNNDWAGGITSTVDALLTHLGPKALEARQLEREQAEVDRRRREAEFDAAISSFFAVAIPIVLVIILAFWLRSKLKERARLKYIQGENSLALEKLSAKLPAVVVTISEAGRVFSGLRDVNINSVRVEYEQMTDDIMETKNESVILAKLLISNLDRKQAYVVADGVRALDTALSKAEARAQKIIALPAEIESKKKWVLSQTESVRSKFKESQSLFTEVASRLTEKFNNEIDSLLNEAGMNLRRIEVGSATPNPDWHELNTLLAVSYGNSEQVPQILKTYFGLVDKAKKEKTELMAKLKTAESLAVNRARHQDVEDSTKKKVAEAVESVESVKKMALELPDDQSWFLFLVAILGATKALNDVAELASGDCNRAEKERLSIARRAEEDSQAQSTSSSSPSSSFTEFGGGDSGGGGASREF